MSRKGNCWDNAAAESFFKTLKCGRLCLREICEDHYPLRGAGIYLVEGKVVVEYGCPSIEVIRCAKMPLKPDPRSE
ncbi:hypothetical protein [Sphingobacterium athyrii]|nr:hypothetical protein [Sphingobacterium athyrii]